MKVTVKRKTKAGSSSRHISGDNRWRNVQGKSGYRNLNQRKMIRATLNPGVYERGHNACPVRHSKESVIHHSYWWRQQTFHVMTG